MAPHKIFISYAWGGESERIAEAIEKELQGKGLEIIRDKKAIPYKGSIKTFMQEIGRGHAIITVISDKYLKSENCMFELLEIAENKNFYDRVFPIVLEDAKIYKAVDRIPYIKYWEDEKAKLNKESKALDDLAYLKGINETINHYSEIRRMIDGLVGMLSDMNSLTIEIHEDTEYEALYTQILEKLKATLPETTDLTDERESIPVEKERSNWWKRTIHWYKKNPILKTLIGVLPLLAFFGIKNVDDITKLFENADIPEEITFTQEPGYKVLLLPFQPLESCTFRDTQLERTIQTRLLEMSEEQGLGLQVLFDTIQSCPKDFSDARVIGNSYFQLATCYYNNEIFTSSVDYYTKVIELCQEYAAAYNNRGLAKYNLGDFEGAIADCNIANELEPEHATPYINRGLAKNKQGDFKGAFADYAKAIELDSGSAVTYINRGLARKELGNFEGAIADYTKAIELDSGSAAAYDNRGFAKYTLRDFEGAVDDFTKAIELDPEFAVAYNNRGGAKKVLRDFEGAIADFTKAIELDPEFAMAYNNRGFVNKELGNFKGAVDDFTKAIELNPKLAAAYNNRGLAKYNQGDFEGAVDDFTKAIKLNPEHAMSYDYRGIARYSQGDIEGAFADFTKAIELDPEFAMAYNNRGSVKYSQGDIEGAIADFTKAIELDPNFTLALNNLESLRQKTAESKN